MKAIPVAAILGGNSLAARSRYAWLMLFMLLTSSVRAADLLFAFGSNPGSLPIYVAQERGLFAAEGVSVRGVECKFGKQCLGLMLDGKAQIATVADLPIVLAAFAGTRMAIIATVNTNRDDTKLVTRRGSNIHSVHDLAGRRVGTVTRTTSQYALDAQLLFNGVDPSSVHLIDLPPDEMKTALLARRVDAIAVFEPYAFEIVKALGADAVTMVTNRIYTQTWNLVVPSLASDRERADLTAVLKALRLACEWIASEPVMARTMLRQRLGMSADLVDAAWPSLNFRVDLTQSLLTTMEAEARWAIRRGVVKGQPPDLLNYIDASVLRVVHPASVTLVQ